MCRLAAYIGSDPLPLSALLYDPPHSLQHAAYAPKELLRGTVNVDGTGVAWWSDGDDEPMRYVTVQPPWSDPNLPTLAGRLKAPTILAAVRSATPGLPFGTTNVSPYTSGTTAGVHNGWIGGFRSGVGRQLLGRLSDQRFGEFVAFNDSLALFLLVMQQIDEQPEAPLDQALTAVIEEVAKVVVAAGETATLNLVLANGAEIVAVRTSVNFRINSLYTRTTATGTLLASEPLASDEDWTAVHDHSLVVLTKDHVALRTIDHEGAT